MHDDKFILHGTNWKLQSSKMVLEDANIILAGTNWRLWDDNWKLAGSDEGLAACKMILQDHKGGSQDEDGR